MDILEITNRREIKVQSHFDLVLSAVAEEVQTDVIGRAVCWLGYRALESGFASWLEEAIAISDRMEAVVNGETRIDARARWLSSMLMMKLYCKLALGKKIDNEADRIASDSFIEGYPVCGVNVCRALVINSSACASSGNLEQSRRMLELCHSEFRKCASRIRLVNVHFCAGAELVSVSKAVHVAVALAGHYGAKYAGELYSRSVILDIERYPFFRNALDSAMPDFIR